MTTKSEKQKKEVPQHTDTKSINSNVVNKLIG